MPQTLQVMTGTDAEGKAIFTAMEVPTADEMTALQEKLKVANREAMERRLKLEAIEGNKDKPADTVVETPQASSTAAVPPTPAQPVINEDDIVAKAVAKLLEQQQAAATKERELTALLEKHNLPSSILPVLKQSLDPVAAAEELGRAALTFAGSSGGRASKGNSVSDAAKAAFKSLDLDYEE